jgi:hypothetical protein
VTGTKTSLALDRYAGIYDNAFYGELRIEQEGGGLVLRRSAEQWGKLEHWHFDTFGVSWNTSRNPGINSFAIFRVDPNAKVAALEMRGPPFATPYAEGAVFTRKTDPRTAAGGAR